eukprot:6968607-Ditylum_brightwellii.AAC.1
MMKRAVGSLFPEHMWKMVFVSTVSVLVVVEGGSLPCPCHLLNHSVVKGGEVWELSDGGVAL